jgi:hypothetical protein
MRRQARADNNDLVLTLVGWIDERLEHGADAMAQVDAQQADAQNVEARDPVIRKPDDHHPVNVVPTVGVAQVAKPGINNHQSVVGQMECHEREYNQTAPNHRSGGEAGVHDFLHFIAGAARRPVFQRQRNGGPNMYAHEHQQANARRPEDLRSRLQKVAVAVDRLWSEKYLQVPE